MSNRVSLTVTEAADAAGVGHTKIRQEIASGRLTAKRAGKLLLIAIEDLRMWLDNLPRAAA